jgi:hypothetical protein
MTPQFDRLRASWADLYRVLEGQIPPPVGRRAPDLEAAASDRERDDASLESTQSQTADARELVEAVQGTARDLEMDAVVLPAHRAFPSAELAAVRRGWRGAVHAVEIQRPRLPVLSCTTVAPVVIPRVSLAERLTAAIRVRQSQAALGRVGVRRMHVIPTGPLAS